MESRGVVKSFYSTASSAPDAGSPAVTADPSWSARGLLSRARVAIYDAPAAAPRIVDVEPAPVSEYIEAIASAVYELAKEQGGEIPYSVIREVSENLIHAAFTEPVISILDKGRTIRFADRGPGIADKDKAVLPGFTTASGEMKRYIRGVGSGLPLVRDYLDYSGGGLVVEDNLGHGAVVTVTSDGGRRLAAPADPLRSAGRPPVQPPIGAFQQNVAPTLLDESDTQAVAGPRLTTRQKQVLALVMESGSAGPSLVARELNVGVSTAYRDLASLGDMGLIEADGGKRSLTSRGLSYLNALTSAS